MSNLADLPWLTQVGELATERVLRIAKAAEEARKKGLEAARAAGDLELGAGDGVGAHLPAALARAVVALLHVARLTG